MGNVFSRGQRIQEQTCPASGIVCPLTGLEGNTGMTFLTNIIFPKATDFHVSSEELLASASSGGRWVARPQETKQGTPSEGEPSTARAPALATPNTFPSQLNSTSVYGPPHSKSVQPRPCGGTRHGLVIKLLTRQSTVLKFLKTQCSPTLSTLFPVFFK